MKTLKSIILLIKRLFKKKAIVRDMKPKEPEPNYSSEVNRLLAPDEDQVILDPHENAIS